MEKLPDNYPTRNVIFYMPARNLLIDVWVAWQMTRDVNVYNMHIIHTVEESRWGKSSRRTVVVHIMSESSYGGYFLPGVMEAGGGGGLNSVHCVTSSHAFIEALFFHRVCSFPSHVHPHPPVCVCSLVSVVTLFLPAASLTASTSIRHSHFFL